MNIISFVLQSHIVSLRLKAKMTKHSWDENKKEQR